VRVSSDNKSIIDGRDRIWVALNELYEVHDAAVVWLSRRGLPATQTNINTISSYIRVFPSEHKRQGRVPRAELYIWLDEVDAVALIC
jgi:hypothetical protein